MGRPASRFGRSGSHLMNLNFAEGTQTGTKQRDTGGAAKVAIPTSRSDADPTTPASAATGTTPAVATLPTGAPSAADVKAETGAAAARGEAAVPEVPFAYREAARPQPPPAITSGVTEVVVYAITKLPPPPQRPKLPESRPGTLPAVTCLDEAQTCV